MADEAQRSEEFQRLKEENEGLTSRNRQLCEMLQETEIKYREDMKRLEEKMMQMESLLEEQGQLYRTTRIQVARQEDEIKILQKTKDGKRGGLGRSTRGGTRDVSGDSDADGSHKGSVKSSKTKKLWSSKVKGLSSTSDSDTQDSVGSEDLSSEESHEEKKTRRKSRGKRTGMCIKEMPEIDVYDAASGRPFKRFVRTFERYCREKYSCAKRDWTGALGHKLTGEMLEVYTASGGSDVQYEDMIETLGAWYRRRIKSGKTSNYQRFEEMKMKIGESIIVYAARLEARAKKAFPGESLEKIKRLMQKFLDTIPKEKSTKLSRAVKEHKILHGKKMTWSKLLDLAAVYETSETRGKEPDGEHFLEVFATLPTENRQRRLEGRERDIDQRTYRENNKQFTGTAQREYSAGTGYGRNYPQTYNEQRFRGYDTQGAGYNQTDFQGRCFKCNELGHYASQCKGIQGTGCYRCGGKNHRAMDCNTKLDRQELICYRCNKTGHIARNCYANIVAPQEYQRGGAPTQPRENQPNAGVTEGGTPKRPGNDDQSTGNLSALVKTGNH